MPGVQKKKGIPGDGAAKVKACWLENVHRGTRAICCDQWWKGAVGGISKGQIMISHCTFVEKVVKLFILMNYLV